MTSDGHQCSFAARCGIDYCLVHIRRIEGLVICDVLVRPALHSDASLLLVPGNGMLRLGTGEGNCLLGRGAGG